MRTFKERLSSGKFLITSEIGPPKGVDTERMLQHIDFLKDRVDGLNMTDNQSSVMRLSPLAGCKLILERGGCPILQLTCRDRNRLALQSDLLGAYTLGIENILCLTGDHITMGDHKEARQVFDLESVQLIRAARILENGRDLSANPLTGSPSFVVGAVATPEAEPLLPQLLKFEKKIRAGARFFQTQAVYDMDRLHRFMDYARRFEGIKILVGILVLLSPGMIRYLNESVAGVHVPQSLYDEMNSVAKEDRIKKGIEIAARQIREIKREKLADGVHIMAIGKEEIVPEIIAEADL